MLIPTQQLLLVLVFIKYGGLRQAGEAEGAGGAEKAGEQGEIRILLPIKINEKDY